MGIVIAIVGRPNVGKSTLFNRLTNTRKAIVEDTPGVTRDRNYGVASYEGYEFIVVDTGGFDFGESTSLIEQMRAQAQLAIEEADVILFLTDARQGWMPDDQEVYHLLIKSNKAFYLVVNKVDDPKVIASTYEFYESGVDSIFNISAQHNRGIDDLLAKIHQKHALVSDKEEETKENTSIRIAFVGKTNVGKSSLVNAFLGEERMIVNEFAGTTRDSVDNVFKKDGQEFILVDTAGIRKKSKVAHKLETFSIISSLKSIERADVALLVIDGVEGVTTQVMKVANYIEYRKKPMIIVVNKCDIFEKDHAYTRELEESIKERLGFVDYAPVVFVSATTRKRISKLLEKVCVVYQQRNIQVSTPDLNKVLQQIIDRTPPPARLGRPTRVYYGTQVATNPPTFCLFTNHSDSIRPTYTRYVVHQLRHHFGFEGSMIEVLWRERSRKSKNNED